MNYLYLSHKRGVVEFSLDVVARVLQYLDDAGVVVVGSLDNRTPDTVLLIVAGDTLPDECARQLHFIRPLLTKETYGKQSIVRVTELELGEVVTIANPRMVA